MFDSADLSHRTDKEEYKKEEARLREGLLNAQYDLKESGRFSVLILIAGVEGAGKGETVNLLNEWMDPRHIVTSGFAGLSDEERERPEMWRYWRALPPKGRIGVFFGAWHTLPLVARVQGRIGKGALSRHITEIRRFEKMLCDEGVLLLKYWFHLSKPQQKKRLKSLEKSPRTRWRVTPQDWKYFKLYDRFVEVCEPFLRETSTGEAPWTVVPGADRRYRSLTFGRSLLAALRGRLGKKTVKANRGKAAPVPAGDGVNVLRALDLDREMSKEKYDGLLEKWQGRLNLLSRHPGFRDRAAVLVFEGNDAAGKGGAVRRLTAALDARSYLNVPVAAPTEEERAQPYLWRFWRHVPRRGRFTIFDRSWYGRVLVERVEGFCGKADWMRAYAEINDFEQQLAARGILVVKFWLAISKEEQFARFKAREKIPFKRFKITAEDWRNREKWEDYESAVCDMVDRTSTSVAPWVLVEANNKYYARIKVLKSVAEAMRRVLEGKKK